MQVQCVSTDLPFNVQRYSTPINRPFAGSLMLDCVTYNAVPLDQEFIIKILRESVYNRKVSSKITAYVRWYPTSVEQRL